ncbi:MAG: hypothetical protein GC151_13235 [Betaproteobacteria bacterium]|nr:hypothetical protein [Betaproteobacteria bacterium]
MNTAPSQFDLSELQKPEDYALSRQSIFPAISSFQWFLRRHRERLAADGALVHIAGRNYIHPQRADHVIADIGAELARGRSGGRRVVAAASAENRAHEGCPQ